MKKHGDLEEIIKEINNLLQELVAISANGHQKKSTGRLDSSDSKKKFIGPSGGIKLLIKDSFFAKPKILSDVVGRLHQDGFRYPTKTISVYLLRFVRNRMLVRLLVKNRKKNEKWEYAERK